MKQIVHENSKTVVDTYTGELIEETTSKVFTIKKEVEPFFLTYSRFMSILYNLNSLATVKILWKFLELAKYNTGEVFITPQIKKNIIESLKISLSVYNKALVNLKDAEIISGERGLYVINPKIHWKGDFKTRENIIRSGLKITIEPDDSFEPKEEA
jgi:hypothetical protein